MGGGVVSSQRILIEDALRPRALPQCSYIHTLHCMHCNVDSHTLLPLRYILLNSIKPFYTGSPLLPLHILWQREEREPVNRKTRTSALFRNKFKPVAVPRHPSTII